MEVNPVSKKPEVSARVEPTSAALSFSDYLKGRLPPQQHAKKPSATRSPVKPSDKESTSVADNHYRPGALLSVEA
ncbi:hypothetical protein [Burkholderia ubonensis]|uniref:hypothetical protein n=1 Tax=Burkholderia ubonensis TaxID=101571 RepID=UPI000754D5B7|nr:hypothetical protein [Burkholderia ubonensis]KVP75320.1 hypothetical protein WJ93_07850 [Burkholderia ubonensis]